MNLLEVASKYAPSSALQFTIAKEILHYDILEILYSNPIGKMLVFQGGTALRLCYNNDRYSEDLDFVVADGFSFNPDDMQFFKKTFQERILKKYKLEIELDEPKNDENIVKKYTAKILLPLANRQKVKINIEIAQIPSHDNILKIINNNYPNEFNVNAFVRVESREEIFADKIIALGSRPYLKFRDFWDIKFLNDLNIALDIELIRAKINDYKIENFGEKLRKRIEIIKSEDLTQDFLNEMSRFLEPRLLEFVKHNSFFNDVKRAVVSMGEESLDMLEHQPASKPYIGKHRKA